MALWRGVLLYLKEKRWLRSGHRACGSGGRQVGGGRRGMGSRCFRWKSRVYMLLERRPSGCRLQMEWRARLVVVERSKGSAGWK